MPRVAKIKCIICGKGSIKSGMLCIKKKNGVKVESRCEALYSKTTDGERLQIRQLFALLEENNGPIWEPKEIEAYRKPIIDKILRSVKNRAIARSKDLIAQIEKSLHTEEPIMPTDGQLTTGLPDFTRRLLIGWPSMDTSINENPLYEKDTKEPNNSQELLDYNDLIDDDPMDCE